MNLFAGDRVKNHPVAGLGRTVFEQLLSPLNHGANRVVDKHVRAHQPVGLSLEKRLAKFGNLFEWGGNLARQIAFNNADAARKLPVAEQREDDRSHDRKRETCKPLGLARNLPKSGLHLGLVRSRNHVDTLKLFEVAVAGGGHCTT